MTIAPRSGMVLAAGLGTRLRPVTATIPKPLIEINGRTLLDHAIDQLARAGVERIVVNIHYKAAMVAAQLARRLHPQIEISEETELLDTGGGVAQALALLEDVFFVVNSDVLWQDREERALQRLADVFDADRMDAVLLLQPTATAFGYEGSGDYSMDAFGKPHRGGGHVVDPYIFAGVQLLHRRLFDGVSDRCFSLVRLFDRAERTGRLHAIVHDGEWYHIGTVAGLAATRQRLAPRRVDV